MGGGQPSAWEHVWGMWPKKGGALLLLALIAM